MAFLEAIDTVGNRGITAVLRRANYEYDAGRNYIHKLVDEGLVDRSVIKSKSKSKSKARSRFKLTQKGKRFLVKARKQDELIDFSKEKQT